MSGCLAWLGDPRRGWGETNRDKSDKSGAPQGGTVRVRSLRSWARPAPRSEFFYWIGRARDRPCTHSSQPNCSPNVPSNTPSDSYRFSTPSQATACCPTTGMSVGHPARPGSSQQPFLHRQALTGSYQVLTLTSRHRLVEGPPVGSLAMPPTPTEFSH